MDSDEKAKITNIIRQEIEIEDDMIALYSGIIKIDEFFKTMSKEDRELADGIIDGLIRDTNRHKKTMQEIIQQL